MKARHVKIVDEIDVMYREIEAETQQQFNNFVQRLKNQYSQKSTTFKQVIELYQEELKKNKNYWQSKAEVGIKTNKILCQCYMILEFSHQKQRAATREPSAVQKQQKRI